MRVGPTCDADRLWGIRDGATVAASPSTFTCAACFTARSASPMLNTRP